MTSLIVLFAIGYNNIAIDFKWYEYISNIPRFINKKTLLK